MDLTKVVDCFYYDMVLNELQMRHEGAVDGNITYNSLLYLDLIQYKKNCTVTYLANVLHISKSAVTIKINELVKRGMVEKIQDQKDRRIYYLKVSSEVAKTYEIYDKKAEYAAKKMRERFSKEEIDQFCSMVAAYNGYYQQGDAT